MAEPDNSSPVAVVAPPLFPPNVVKDFEDRVLRDSVGILVEYMREFRHNVYFCDFCCEDWSTADEYFAHTPCRECGNTEEDKLTAAAGALNAKWKAGYNKFREISKGILGGTLPFKVVPYCTCERFKDVQDCNCMKEKRREALKKLLKEPVETLFHHFQLYIQARRELDLIDVTEERDQNLRYINGRYVGEERGDLRRAVFIKAQQNMDDVGEKFWTRYKDLVTAVQATIDRDLELLDELGRRPIERQTLNAAQIDDVCENCLYQLNQATFLARCWGDLTGTQLVNSGIRKMQNGVERNDMIEVADGSQELGKAMVCVERAAVYSAIIAKCTFAFQEYDNPAMSKSTNAKTRQALDVDLIEAVEDYNQTWKNRSYDGENWIKNAEAVLDATLLPIVNLNEGAEGLLNTAVEICRKWRSETAALMETVRSDTGKEDWELLGTHIFHLIVSVLANPEVPVYPIQDIFTEFRL
uniref:Uncharacterized protein n=1 Tax=Caenorhabditis japonica TaxID=281687 RepID=A0A8R1DT31_CAEJA